MRSSRFLVLLLAVLPFSPSTVMAGRNTGGALIVHTNDAYSFSSSTACTTTYGLPASCEEAITRSDKSVGTVVWLLAAFPDTTSPSVAGIYFGIDYDDSLSIQAWKFCGPAGTTEVTDDDWPFEGRGNSLAFAEPVEGQHLFPFYVFKIDGGTDSCYFSTAVNPTGGYAAFVDDAFPPSTDEVGNFGTIHWYSEGTADCPSSSVQDSGAGEDDSSTGWDSEGDEGLNGGDSEELPEPLTYVTLATASDSACFVVGRQIEKDYGIQGAMLLGPDAMVCRAPSALRADLAEDVRVIAVTTDSVDTSSRTSRPDTGRLWNALLGSSPDTLSTAQRDTVFIRDYFPPAREDYQTSAYMLGRIVLQFIFIESLDSNECNPTTGVPENWDWENDQPEAFLGTAIKELRLAFVESEPNAYVEFLIPSAIVDTVNYEPIQMSAFTQVWPAAAYANLGYAGYSSAIEAGYAYLNDLRATHRADWACTIFIVNASCDLDHRWPETWVAGTANMYGPYAVLMDMRDIPSNPHYTYSAHETAHMFGAFDEHEMGCGNCEALGGYLHVVNGNCETACENVVPCLMRDGVSGMCDFTKGQIGLLDSDSDGAMDPIDHPNSGKAGLIMDEENPLTLGDRIVIMDGEDFVKSIAVSEWSSDGGVVVWDGMDYAGNEVETGTYTWLRNGEAGGVWSWLGMRRSRRW